MKIAWDKITPAQKEELRRQLDAADAKKGWPVFRGVSKAIQTDTRHEVMLAGPADCSKAQPLDAIVYTASGPRKMGDLSIGDRVVTPDGRQAEILGIYPQGEKDVYRVTFWDGDSAECTDDHLWLVNWQSKTGSHKKKRIHVRNHGILPLSEIRRRYLTPAGRQKLDIPLTEPVRFDRRAVRIDPYVLGVLLGDGCISPSGISIASEDSAVIAEVRRRLGELYEVKYQDRCTYRVCAKGFRPRRASKAKPGYALDRGTRWLAIGRVAGWTRQSHLAGGPSMVHLGSFKTREAAEAAVASHAARAFSPEDLTGIGIWADIESYGLSNKKSPEKFVPEDYMWNDAETRLDLLRGLMDTDGTVSATGLVSFTSTSKVLAEQVSLLVKSFGGTTRVRARKAGYRSKKTGGYVNCKTAYHVSISHDDAASLFLLQRKRDKVIPRTQYPVRRMIANIELVRRAECQCISVATEQGLYLTDNFAVTHNTWGLLWDLDTKLRETPNAHAAMVRKVRADMSASMLKTWKKLSAIRGAPKLAGGLHAEWWDYPNGARVYAYGLDRHSKALGAEFDFIAVSQCEELSHEEWSMLASRASGRGAVTKNPVIRGDCNPGPPSHWIINRSELNVLYAAHTENPELYDDAGNILPEGTKRLAKLDALPGVMKERLRYGRWVSAEGVVYPGFSRDLHCVPHIEQPQHVRRFRVIDFGFQVFACLWAVVDADERITITRQIYRSKMRLDEHIREILRLSEGENYEATIGDSADPEAIEVLNHSGIPCIPARKGPDSVLAGIQLLSARLAKAGDGRPRFFVEDGSLVERDRELAEEHRPTSLIEEFEVYSWRKGANGPLDEPEKRNDHACDAARYLCLHVDKWRSLAEEDVNVAVIEPWRFRERPFRAERVFSNRGRVFGR